MLLFQHDIVVKTTVFFMQKYNTVHVCIVQNARWNTNVLSLNIAAILPCTSLYLHPIVAMHSMFNIQEFQAAISTWYCSESHYILPEENCLQNALALHGILVETQVFSQKIFKTKWTSIEYHIALCSICNSFKLLFQWDIAVKGNVFYTRMLNIMFAYIATNSRWNISDWT